MKKIVIRIIVFFILLEVLSVLVFMVVDFSVNKSKKCYNKDAIYVWGDSQIYRGIDIEKLHEMTGKPVYSSAQEGSGVYDFYTFTTYVPDSSVVLLGFSKTILVRSKNKDYNLSGLSIDGLCTMKEKGYGWGDVLYIFKNNIQPYKYYTTQSDLLPNADSTIIFEAISFFQSQFSNFIDLAQIKKEVFLEGLDNLKRKGNKIIVLELPYHQKFLDAVAASDVDEFLEDFAVMLNNDLGIVETSFHAICPQKNVMSDYTHLNQRGSELITNEFYNKYLKNEVSGSQHIIYSIETTN